MDEPANLVRLTYREHFLAHLLLVKIHRADKLAKKKLAAAVIRMSDRKKLTSKQYEIGMRLASESLRDSQIYEWWHPVYGEESCTVSELVNKYGLKSTSNLFKVAREQFLRSRSGWMLKKNSTVDYAAARRSRMKLSSRAASEYDWWHPQLGSRRSTAFDLVRAVDRSLKVGRLLSVAYGERLEYGGWRLAKNAELDLVLEMSRRRTQARLRAKKPGCSDKEVRTWIHPTHGKFTGTVDELLLTFDDLSGRSSSFLKVIRGPNLGGQSSCKGWKLCR